MSFDGFADVWTPVCLRRRIGRKPVRVVIANEPLVLFRDGRGGLGALLDRCPHRGVALSLGRVVADGTLECPFHGWRFDVAGANRAVPLNPEARCETLGAMAIPVREIGDLVWVYTHPKAMDVPEPVVPESSDRSDAYAHLYRARLGLPLDASDGEHARQSAPAVRA